ncbi:MAG: hypothetical protein ACPHK8_03875 [Thermoplasmatota archaeon]
MKLKLLALALLLLLPASAQLEPITDGLSPSLELSMPSEGTVSVESPETFEITITNTATATGTPLDQPVEVKLQSSGAPEGWVVEFSPTVVDVMPGASATVDMIVSAAPGSASEGDLTVRAFANSGLGPLVGEGDAEATISITTSESATRSLLEALGPGVWVILALLVLTVILAIVMFARANRKSIQLHTSDEHLQLEPGTRVDVPITVRNVGREATTAVLDVSESQNGWAAFMLTPEIRLKAGGQEETQFVVIVPEDATSGADYVISASALVDSKPTTLRIKVSLA